MVNDGGGSIFSLLEHGEDRFADVHERYFGTPQDVDVAALCRPGRTTVVDEAFADAVPGEGASVAARRDLPGLVVVRSPTKTWALAGLRVGRRVLIHLNNTNPVLLADSPERSIVAAAGWEVAEDGMEFTL